VTRGAAAARPSSAPAAASAADGSSSESDSDGSGSKRQPMYVHYRSATRTWRAVVCLPVVAARLLGIQSRNAMVPISNVYPTAALAARAADLAQLALLGPWKGMKLNYPIWDYSAAEQQPKTGAELSRYILWLKEQAVAAVPFAGCGFAARAAAARREGGEGEGAAGAVVGRRERPGMQQQLANIAAGTAKRRSYHCGMCTGCLMKGRCVVAVWQKQEVRCHAVLCCAMHAVLCCGVRCCVSHSHRQKS
jgi:hypothetical protein